MQATRILAIRHGETAWNVDTRIQGHLDIPLNAKGMWQAEQLAKTLVAQDPLHAVYSSDLQRAHQTATAVAVQQGLEAITLVCASAALARLKAKPLPKLNKTCLKIL
jgi:probable phosphoglycerate mutase